MEPLKEVCSAVNHVISYSCLRLVVGFYPSKESIYLFKLSSDSSTVSLSQDSSILKQ